MTKVGVIVVTFNRADVTCLALDSIARAKNATPYKLFVVDNNSNASEQFQIKESFDYLKAKKHFSGEIFISDKNLGFSAGNNIGLRAALADKKITHICLLNNDTIVTPYWLDRILAHNPKGLIGPVSNSVGNEQIVPIPYAVTFSNGYTRETVWNFAQLWHQDHDSQNVTTDMLGFFCVLGPRAVFEVVGELDENFGIGTFEDDDYCARVVKAGYPLQIARDVFIHHWGSASFSKIKYNRLIRLMNRNRQLFENKHQTIWKSPIAKLPLAYKAEVENALIQKTGSDARRKKVIANLGKFISDKIEFLFCPFDPLNPRRRIIAFKLTFSPPMRLVNLCSRLIKIPAYLKNYLTKSTFRNHVNSKFACWSRAAVRLAKKKFNNLRQKISPGKKNLICFPICPYRGRKQRPQHLLEKLSIHYDRSFWIEPQDVTFNGILRASPQIQQVFLKGNIRNFYTTQISAVAKNEVDTTQLELLVPRRGEIVAVVQALYWVGHLIQLKEIAEKKKTKLTIVYDCMDHHVGFGSALFITELHEKNIIELSDFLIASSNMIEDFLKQFGKPVVKIKNACGVDNFPLIDTPPRTKIVGYFGAIAEWFDWDLVKAAAERLPEVRFELIGDYYNIAERVKNHPSNIVFHGEIPFGELKNYAKDWDAALIPFCITPLIEATNPVKLYEYSALGIPVISTPIPEVLRESCDAIIAVNADTLVKAIEKIFLEDTSTLRKARRRFAEKNTWEERAARILEVLH